MVLNRAKRLTCWRQTKKPEEDKCINAFKNFEVH